MNVHRYTPMWRAKSGVPLLVEVVEDPDSSWFSNLVTAENGQSFRFALMEDGRIYFGDAYHVVHHDIMQCRGADGTVPLYVSVATYHATATATGTPADAYSNVWILGSVQQFLGSRGQEERVAKCLCSLLARMDNWRAAVEAMGGDPTERYIGDPTWQKRAP